MSNSIAGVPSIIGEQFPDFVVKQIERRQKIHGSTNRTPQQLQYLHAKTATCALASSVDIKSFSRFKNTALSSFSKTFGEAELAQMFVLENGVTGYSGFGTDGNTPIYHKTYHSGINRSSQVSDIKTATATAYGYGGLEFGQVPMPGIISMNTRSENRGSLRTAEVKIKAYNKVQFDIIDTLFLRLGYTVLLEWKWGQYFDNNGNWISDNSHTCIPQFLAPNKYFSVPNPDQDDFLNLIRTTKENSNGNYDALLAKVKNFNWSFNKDGSYDITLSLVSIGDIIESLNVRVVDPKQSLLIAQDVAEKNKTDLKELLNESDDDNEVITAYKNTSALASYLYRLIDNNGAPDATFIDPGAALAVLLGLASPITGLVTTALGATAGQASGITRIDEEETNTFNVNHNQGDFLSLLVDYTWQNENAYFVRFGHILDWMEKNLIISNTKSPGLRIDTRPFAIYTHPDLVSTNLSICAINKRVSIYTTKTTLDYYWNLDREVTDDIEIRNALPNGKPFLIKGKTNQGDLMNVYLNLRFILTTLESKIDSEGKLSLLDFITELCTGINNAFANVNKISPAYDHDTNTMYFVDETPVDRDWVAEPPNTKFELYGYDPTNSTAGFIRDFSLKSEITPALATTITVGAQANAKPVGESQTAFSKWNDGLIDRIWKEKYFSSASVNDQLTDEELKQAERATQKNIKNLTLNYYDWIRKCTALIDSSADYYDSDRDQKISPEALSGEFGPAMSAMINYHNQLWAITNSSGSSPTDVIGFIPVNLSLTMDGLSGMKIYQRFNTDTRFLPPKYTNELEFIVKGISHTVENNQWTTNIETFMVPKIIASPTSTLLTRGETKPSGTNLGKTDTDNSTSTSTNVTSVDNGQSKDMEEAIRLAANATFKNFETTGYCAWGVWQVAHNLKNVLTNRPTKSPDKFYDTNSFGSCGGDAESPGFATFLTNFGYNQLPDQIFTSSPSLRSYLSDPKNWGIGDIVVYVLKEQKWNKKKQKWEPVRHTQLYTGNHHDPYVKSRIENLDGTYNQASDNYIKSINKPCGWTTDHRNNYGNPLVFGYAATPKDYWTLKVFKWNDSITRK